MRAMFGSAATNGRVLTAFGVIALSPDGLLTRLVTADIMTVLWWRTLLTAAGIAAALLLWRRAGAVRIVRESLALPGLAVAILFGTGTVFFVLSITYTAVANTLVILAAGPIFGAWLSRLFLREPISAETWAAALFVLVGLGALFADSVEMGRLFGDACALVAALCTSGAFVLLRRYRRPDPLVLVATGSLLACMAVTPFAAPLSVDGRDLMFLALLGVVVLPVAFALIFAGPRYIPAPEVALLMLLETALGPLWVWLVIGEVPSARVAAAGALIIATLAAHSAFALRHDRAKSAPP